MTHLKALFSPHSITVIGASGRDGSLGKMFMDALTGMPFRGDIYPVNPKTEKINGLVCRKDIGSLPDKVDLAVILLPKEKVLAAINELSDKGIKTVIVISAGFREVGVEGLMREKALLERIKQSGMRMLGPNCMGVFNTAADVGMNATFAPIPLCKGNAAFISQSGALGVAVLDLSKSLSLGFSCFVSTGNKADINEVDCLEYLITDNNTKSILLYQESIDNPRELREICRRIIPKKPVLTIKAGRTPSGLNAASSHTGALASDDLLADAFFKQSGIIRCGSLNEMLNTALAFESPRNLPGRRIAVVTNAGGPGILACDALENQGFDILALSAETTRKLRSVLPAEASVKNPVDMIASATHDTYREVCQLLAKDSRVDLILINIVRPPGETTAGRIVEELLPLLEKTKKYVAFCMMTDPEENDGRALLSRLKIPVYTTPETAAQALGNLIKYKKIRERLIEDDRDSNLRSRKINPLQGAKRQAKQDEIFPLLDNYQLAYAPYLLASEKTDVLDFFRSAGCVVLKVANEDIIHKSDLGLVKTALASERAVSRAFDQIKEKIISLVPDEPVPVFLVQQMIENGIELVLGSKRDDQFGTVIMFGIGGIFIELYRDVAFRIAPINRSDVLQMIEELHGKKLLEGFRNFPRIDKNVIADMILNFVKLVEEHPEIVEADLNPIIWSEKHNGPIIVDSRCTLIDKKI